MRLWARLIDGVLGVKNIIAAVGVTVFVLAMWDFVFDDPAVRRAATAQERIKWEESRRRLLAQMAEERRAAQEAIDKVEREYLAQRQRDALSIAALEEEIANMDKDDAASNRNSSSRLFIPRRLSERIDAVGR